MKIKKYKCISTEFLTNKNTLTIGKIYDVFEQDITNEKLLYIISNDNMYMYFTTRINDFNYIGNWFEDTTAEIRDNKIEQILKKKF